MPFAWTYLFRYTYYQIENSYNKHYLEVNMKNILKLSLLMVTLTGPMLYSMQQAGQMALSTAKAIDWKKVKTQVIESPRWVKAMVGLALAGGTAYMIYKKTSSAWQGIPGLPIAAPAPAPIQAPIQIAAPVQQVQNWHITHAPDFIQYTNRDRDTRLHQAVRADNEQLTRTLLAAGHTPYVRNLYNETPASIARSRGPYVQDQARALVNGPVLPQSNIQLVIEHGVREYEANRALLPTILNETIIPLNQDGQEINKTITELVFGPNSQAFNTL